MIRLNELTSLIQKRWKNQGTVKLVADRVNQKGLSAITQAESMIHKIKVYFL
jgi:small subunit ribosomal protein S3e